MPTQAMPDGLATMPFLVQGLDSYYEWSEVRLGLDTLANHFHDCLVPYKQSYRCKKSRRRHPSSSSPNILGVRLSLVIKPADCSGTKDCRAHRSADSPKYL